MREKVLKSLLVVVVVDARFDRFFRERIRQENARRLPISKQVCLVGSIGISKLSFDAFFSNLKQTCFTFRITW